MKENRTMGKNQAGFPPLQQTPASAASWGHRQIHAEDTGRWDNYLEDRPNPHRDRRSGRDQFRNPRNLRDCTRSPRLSRTWRDKKHHPRPNALKRGHQVLGEMERNETRPQGRLHQNQRPSWKRIPQTDSRVLKNKEIRGKGKTKPKLTWAPGNTESNKNNRTLIERANQNTGQTNLKQW